jgi:predicted amidohydrolase
LVEDQGRQQRIDVIQTDIGPIGVLICYDSEFPELARRLVDEGARIIFVPFCTDNRQGYLRVRYCARPARSRTSASSSCPAMSAICRASTIWTSNMPSPAS